MSKKTINEIIDIERMHTDVRELWLRSTEARAYLTAIGNSIALTLRQDGFLHEDAYRAYRAQEKRHAEALRVFRQRRDGYEQITGEQFHPDPITVAAVAP